MKLHLGCGRKFIEGYIHVDLLEYDHIDYQCPVDDLSFAESNSASLIYACHVLEHFGRQEIDGVLVEWFRVLKPGGILRVAVPDFAAVAVEYMENQSIEDVTGLVCGGQKDQYDFHKVIFDETYLAKKLQDAGFSHVERYDWRDTEHAEMDDFSQAYLPHMDKEHGRLMSLNLRATK